MHNPIIAEDAKEFAVTMVIALFCMIKCLNLDKMTSASLFSSQIQTLRGGRRENNVPHMFVFWAKCAKLYRKLNANNLEKIFDYCLTDPIYRGLFYKHLCQSLIH